MSDGLQTAAAAWHDWHEKERPKTHDHYIGTVWTAFRAGWERGRASLRTKAGQEICLKPMKKGPCVMPKGHEGWCCR